MHLLLAAAFALTAFADIPDLHDPDLAKREAALQELARAPRADAIPDLVRAIDDEARLRQPDRDKIPPPPPHACGNDAAYEAQGRIGQQIGGFRGRAVTLLVRLGAPALPARLAGLKNPDESVRIHYIRGQRLAKDPDAVPLLIAEAEKKSPVQMPAYSVLSEYHDPRAIALHLRMLKLFLAAPLLNTTVEELARVRSPEAIEILLAFTRHPRKRVRVQAQGYLARFEDPRIRDLMLELLSSKDKDVRVTSVEALARYPEPRVLAQIVRRMKKSQERYFLTHALSSLSAIGTPATIAEIRPFLKFPDKLVQDYAQGAINTIQFRNRPKP